VNSEVPLAAVSPLVRRAGGYGFRVTALGLDGCVATVTIDRQELLERTDVSTLILLRDGWCELAEPTRLTCRLSHGRTKGVLRCALTSMYMSSLTPSQARSGGALATACGVTASRL